ncbi:3035_t:CDS:2, partial [Acaulospora morrowiae]
MWELRRGVKKVMGVVVDSPDGKRNKCWNHVILDFKCKYPVYNGNHGDYGVPGEWWQKFYRENPNATYSENDKGEEFLMRYRIQDTGYIQ